VVSDNNKYKTGGITAIYTAPSKTVLALNVYSGPEGAGGAPKDWRSLADLVVTQPIGDKLTLMLNGDFGTEGTASWYGAALYARYLLFPNLPVSLRGEYFSDPNGFRTLFTDASGAPLNVSVSEVTATFGRTFGSNVEVRVEYRADFASKKIFEAGQASNQSTVQFGFLAWY
jgi:hypothetical protein